MPKYQKEVQKLRNPENIKEAVYASSPYVLRKAFLADPTVQKLVQAGPAAVADIKQEFAAGADKLSDITLACLAHILSQVAPAEGAALLAPVLRKTMDKGGPFFKHFATHLLRQEVRLPVRPLEMVYRREEMQEVLGRYH
jgi:hypothetical protein